MYSMIWRNRTLTLHANTIKDMIDALRRGADRLEEMRDAGVELSHGAEDDAAVLYTSDYDVANQLGLQPHDPEDEPEIVKGDGHLPGGSTQ